MQLELTGPKCKISLTNLRGSSTVREQKQETKEVLVESLEHRHGKQIEKETIKELKWKATEVRTVTDQIISKLNVMDNQ